MDFSEINKILPRSGISYRPLSRKNLIFTRKISSVKPIASATEGKKQLPPSPHSLFSLTPEGSIDRTQGSSFSDEAHLFDIKV